MSASIDQFGELVRDAAVADDVAADYALLAVELARQPGDVWLAVDLSHLGLDGDAPGCADRLAAIAGRLPDGRRIQVGAEDHAHAGAVFQCVLAVAARGLADRLGATVQANFRRAPADLERLVAAGVHIRLVKGAYVEPADRASPYGEATDIAYLHLAHRLAKAETPFSLATHDGVLREALLASIGPISVEQLLGVRPSFDRSKTGTLEPLEMQLLARLTLGPADDPLAEAGELFESLTFALACDRDDLRDVIHVLRERRLILTSAEQDDDERISITADGVGMVHQWLQHVVPLFGQWPPDNAAVDDAIS